MGLFCTLLAGSLLAGCAGAEKAPDQQVANPTPSSTAAEVSTTVPVTSIPTTTQPPTTASAAPTTAVPADPEVVTVTAGQSVLTFTLPANTTPADREIYQRYIEFRRVLRVTSDPATPDHPGLPNVLVAEYLNDQTERLRLRQQTGQYIRGPWDGHPRIISNSAGVIRVEDCSLDGSGMFDPSGGVIEPIGTAYTTKVIILDSTEGPLKTRTYYNTKEPCVA